MRKRKRKPGDRPRPSCLAGFRVTLITLAAMSISTASFAQQRIHEVRHVESGASIRIINLAGSVHVTGWDRDSVAVVGVPGDSNARFFIGGSDRSLKLGLDTPEGTPIRWPTDLDVRVPAASRVWIKTATGEIDADNLTGEVSAVTVGGRVRIGGTLRELTAESMDGSIEIAADATSARVRTANGTIVLRGVLRQVEASSVSGELLVGMTGPIEHARLETISGNVSFKGPLTADGSLEVESHDGDIELRMPPTLSATYDLNAYGGTIRNELVPRGASVKGEQHLVIGTGSARVSVRTFKGTVAVKAHPAIGR
jgi:DUF4097 and DUF4098 domain-containing protein YvlB